MFDGPGGLSNLDGRVVDPDGFRHEAQRRLVALAGVRAIHPVLWRRFLLVVEVSGDDHIRGLAQKVHHVEVGWHESLEVIAKHVGSLSSSKRMLGEVVRLAPQGFITDPIVTGPLVFKEAAIHAVVVINGYSRRLFCKQFDEVFGDLMASLVVMH